jgi:hypothetical protein
MLTSTEYLERASRALRIKDMISGDDAVKMTRIVEEYLKLAQTAFAEENREGPGEHVTRGGTADRLPPGCD